MRARELRTATLLQAVFNNSICVCVCGGGGGGLAVDL